MGGEFLPWWFIIAALAAVGLHHRWEIWRAGRIDRDLRRYYGPQVAAHLKLYAIEAGLRRLEGKPLGRWLADTEEALADANASPTLANYAAAYALVQRDGAGLSKVKSRDT